MLLQYLTQRHKYNVQKITGLGDLPVEVSQQLETVTQLAAEGIEKQQYVFNKQADKVPSESLGLKQLGRRRGDIRNWNIRIFFLHLILHQNFLSTTFYI